MAPEYLVRGKLTEKVDVYSFVVVFIEVICGKKNNSFTHDSVSILQMVPHFHAAEKYYPLNPISFH